MKKVELLLNLLSLIPSMKKREHLIYQIWKNLNLDLMKMKDDLINW